VDIDGDGKLEILAPLKDGRLAAFEYNGRLRWEKGLSVSISQFACADIDGDGKSEIALVYSQDGAGRCAPSAGDFLLLTSEGCLLKSIHQEEITTCAAVAQEGVVIGCQSGKVQFLHADGSVKWEVSFEKPIRHVLVEDVDGDGQCEVLVGGTGLFLLDATGKIRWRLDLEGKVVEWIATGVIEVEKRGLFVAWELPRERYHPLCWVEPNGSMSIYNITDEDGDPISNEGTQSHFIADLDNDGRDEALVLQWLLFCLPAGGSTASLSWRAIWNAEYFSLLLQSLARVAY
jgi:hypothetical protein